ncbi:hypothetical protein K3G63_02245 [Hymenobacter sp. HSC-4F20]|uniref:hypothetical protein n=1 Tax=Hymenobacter sp. HSC-4F20 TaxID=2864135 RepID=UPI001C72B626|nr:hypothetical protein [Hymenobacter sp. HSC-4F20]MBX0289237.1 hypothetical protein [Hymenobacter sp. HSC-4F20]
MKQLLRRLHLITPFTLELPVAPDELLPRLRQHVAPPGMNPFGRRGRLFSLPWHPTRG